MHLKRQVRNSQMDLSKDDSFAPIWVILRTCMSDEEKAARPWQTVAAELTEERDPGRVAALATELNNALVVDQQERKQAKKKDTTAD